MKSGLVGLHKIKNKANTHHPEKNIFLNFYIFASGFTPRKWTAGSDVLKIRHSTTGRPQNSDSDCSKRLEQYLSSGR